jgi:hypothetical protein
MTTTRDSRSLNAGSMHNTFISLVPHFIDQMSAAYLSLQKYLNRYDVLPFNFKNVKTFMIFLYYVMEMRKKSLGILNKL